MTELRRLAVILIAIVLLAGCSGAKGNDGDSPSSPPASAASPEASDAIAETIEPSASLVASPSVPSESPRGGEASADNLMDQLPAGSLL